MKPIIPLASIILAALLACSRTPETPPAVPPSTTPAADAPATSPPPAPLAADAIERLVRAHSPVLGPHNAPITIVEFLDPACEACRAFAPVVKQVQFLYPADVRVVVRFAAFHDGSSEAVRLLAAAQQQGKFEPVLGALFEAQPEWAAHGAPNPGRAWQVAGAAGLDVAQARRAAQAAAATEVLRVDSEDVVALKVDSTPTFFVNGKPLAVFSPEGLMTAVANELAVVQRPASN